MCWRNWQNTKDQDETTQSGDTQPLHVLPHNRAQFGYRPPIRFWWSANYWTGPNQTKAGRLFMEAVYSDENSINRHITLDPCYALIKDRLTRWTVLIYYKNPCIKIYKRWQSGLATWPMKAPSKKMNVLLTPSNDSNLPLKTPIFLFIKNNNLNDITCQVPMFFICRLTF